MISTLISDPFVEVAEETDRATEVASERTAKLAFEKWCQRGRPIGTAEQDWFEAERELLLANTPHVAAEARAELLAREPFECGDDSYDAL